MVSYNSKVFSEYVRPEFVGSPYDGKTFPFCGGINLFGFYQSSRSVCYNFRHYSEFVLGQLQYRTRLHHTTGDDQGLSEGWTRIERYGDRYPVPPPNLSRSSKEVHSSIKQTIRFILTLGARYNTGLRTCPTGNELCFYTLRNIREIPSMHSKE
ncbi:hypothetical protein TNCV_2545751 [Trichonephila clavipes]|nr:hypothetical protein TNCV_2545751 [Trichonephila clavipes]